MNRETPERKRAREDAFEHACEQSEELCSDPANRIRIAGDKMMGRFPGVEDDGVAVPRRPGSDAEPHGGINSVMTHGPKAWKHPPKSDEEKALFYGFHVHDHNNPLGLHTHVPGGTLAGGHTHSPNNRTGKHTHKENIENAYGPVSLSGDHEHKCQYPDGGHSHPIADFG